MENISEIPQRRGRPRIAIPETAISRRTALNRHYAMRAFEVLGIAELVEDGDDTYLWLFTRRGPKWTILTELGRIEDESAMQMFAVHICRDELSTQQAVATIRRGRVGRATPDADQLASAIMVTVNAYLERYPRTGAEMVSTALDAVWDALADRW